ncbi:hypothetical protein GCM10007100_40140 [Roseibacillus persicicus]|uniref:Uncharacterized protein n=2 Tax=Roseibacillus persicicus TaxID=454148 RepID=A0A918TY68_9BACT|nr:hypothetical protein GCM10007100_40140 [Roseibacillus persicicus]
MEANRRSQALVELLDTHFSNEGYKFRLSYRNLSDDEIPSLLGGPKLLLCNGPFTEESASSTHVEIREILDENELADVEVWYEIRRGDQQYYFPSDQLTTVGNK